MDEEKPKNTSLRFSIVSPNCWLCLAFLPSVSIQNPGISLYHLISSQGSKFSYQALVFEQQSQT